MCIIKKKIHKPYFLSTNPFRILENQYLTDLLAMVFTVIIYKHTYEQAKFLGLACLLTYYPNLKGDRLTNLLKMGPHDTNAFLLELLVKSKKHMKTTTPFFQGQTILYVETHLFAFDDEAF